MNKKTSAASQLPNAPLAEVVFELRWRLKEDTHTPSIFWVDPGYAILVEDFTSGAAKQGFKVARKMGAEGMMVSQTIGLRFYKAEDKPFPIWQIGPGIFAANESAAYEWNAFKELTLDGTKVLLSSYPELKSFRLQPSYLELRYVDSIDSSFIGHQDIFRFLNEQTSLGIELPPFLRKRPIGKSAAATMDFSFPITNMKDTKFRLSVGNGRVDKKETIIVTSKVWTRSDKLSVGNTVASHLQFIGQWLEKAHAITSPFFKDFARDSLMNQFRSVPGA